MLNEVISAVKEAEETAERVRSVGEARAAALREETERRGEAELAAAKQNCLAMRQAAAEEAEAEAARLHEEGEVARAGSRRAWLDRAALRKEEAVQRIVADLVG